jgi:hypothetical protein
MHHRAIATAEGATIARSKCQGLSGLSGLSGLWKQRHDLFAPVMDDVRRPPAGNVSTAPVCIRPVLP